MKEDSSTSNFYGKSVRDFIDQHGTIVRSADSTAVILNNVHNCTCSLKYPNFTDHAVGHVRTQDPAVLPQPLRGLVARGLNYRPRLKSNAIEALDAARNWARQVCSKLIAKKGAWKTLNERVLHMFYCRLRKHTTYRQWTSLASGYSAELLTTQGLVASRKLACTSTDKAANTASFECVHWYRAICMIRLLGPAFAECTEQQSYRSQLATAHRWSPWADTSKPKDAILFAMPKMHKRAADHLSYRYITNACSALSKPVSLEATRVLTILMKTVREHCVSLGNTLDAKLWWSINSLDVVPLNLDRTMRPNRQIAAFDVDKCYEAVPLFEGEHSLLAHLEWFLELAFGSNPYLGSDFDWKGNPKTSGHWCNYPGGAELTYSRRDVLNLVTDLLRMTIVTVGAEQRQQEVGLPMGFSSSGILLDIYLFACEYKFVMRLARLRPNLLHLTHELFRYIDDLGCFGDGDMRVFLDSKQIQSEDNPFWIYPLYPQGPIGIKDQTERCPESTSLVYLDVEYTLTQGSLSFGMHFKGDNLPFKLLRFTHWESTISRACKLGMIYSQTRTACRSASDLIRRNANLSMLKSLFLEIGFAEALVDSTINSAVSVYSERFPYLTAQPDGVARLP
jgi:hypothetical protein